MGGRRAAWGLIVLPSTMTSESTLRSSTLKASLVALTLCAAGAPALAQSTAPASASTPPAAAPAASPLTFNVGAVTDYRYRGISQSRLRPALQVGADYSLGSFYVGTWISTIQWLKDAGTKARGEFDFYGGYKGDIRDGLTYDVGVLHYLYPRGDTSPRPYTTEVYGALTFGPGTVKYSHSVSNTFGFPDSKNSGYLDLAATFDLGGGFMLTPHLGYQRITGPARKPASYADYAVAVSKDFSGAVVTLAVVGTDADKNFYSSPVNGKALGKVGATLGVKYTF
jgi:uncharacterized protein (TIGR02001 family)